MREKAYVVSVVDVAKEINDTPTNAIRCLTICRFQNRVQENQEEGGRKNASLFHTFMDLERKTFSSVEANCNFSILVQFADQCHNPYRYALIYKSAPQSVTRDSIKG